MESPTLIITKEGWMRLRDIERIDWKLKPFTNKTLERIWKKTIKNCGASDKLNPIEENEIRIVSTSFSMPWEEIEEILKKENLPYRQDGYIQEFFYI